LVSRIVRYGNSAGTFDSFHSEENVKGRPSGG
jgi:hypothetical protein